MIIVAGRLEVDPADRDELVRLSGAAVRLARGTPGCRDFAVSADSVDTGRVNVFERWENRDTLEAFRRNGPTDSISGLIRRVWVREYVVADT